MTLDISNNDIKLIFKNKMKLSIFDDDIIEIKHSYATLVFNIKNKYILRVNKVLSENSFRKGYFLLNFFKDKIPCPKVLVFDNSRKLIPMCYGIYERLDGDILQHKWSSYDNVTRKKIIKEICEKLLKVLNNTKYVSKFKDFQTDRYNLNPNFSWHDLIYTEINEYLDKVINQKLLSKNQIGKVKKFIEKNHYLLNESKIKLTYWDLHFNNIIVKNKKIVGFIDFDAICYTSIDNPLYVLQWQCTNPKDYANGIGDYKKKRL